MKTIQELKYREAFILKRLEALNGPTDSHLEAISKSFHLGLVGGSGRNTGRLNKRRERSLDKTISNAVESTALYKELGEVQGEIRDIENNGPEKRAKKAEETANLLVTYWKNLKTGDEIDLGNGPMKIVKKNAKSLITDGGCLWKSSEIIGAKAAALL